MCNNPGVLTYLSLLQRFMGAVVCLPQPVLYLRCPRPSQPCQHVCRLPANSGRHLRGNSKTSYSTLLQAVWTVCVFFFVFTSTPYSCDVIQHRSVSLLLQKFRNFDICLSCRYLQPPATWVQCALESRELLALCLKKLKSSMTKVRWSLADFHQRQCHKSAQLKMVKIYADNDWFNVNFIILLYLK